MKALIATFFFLIQCAAFSQNLESISQEDELIKLESSKIEIIIHSSNSSTNGLDSISIKSKYFETVDFESKILSFNISGIDSKGNIVFTRYPRGNVFSTKFKEKYAKCYECESIRVDKVYIEWYNEGTYTLKQRKQWKTNL